MPQGVWGANDALLGEAAVLSCKGGCLPRVGREMSLPVHGKCR